MNKNDGGILSNLFPSLIYVENRRYHTSCELLLMTDSFSNPVKKSN